MKSETRAWWKDALERLFWTFVQGSFGTLGATEIAEAITKSDLAIGLVFSMLVGGLASVGSFVKSYAATKLSAGETAQLGARTYSYTEGGPGSAGPDMEAGVASVSTILVIVALVCGILALVGVGSLPWLALGIIALAVAILI